MRAEKNEEEEREREKKRNGERKNLPVLETATQGVAVIFTPKPTCGQKWKVCICLVGDQSAWLAILSDWVGWCTQM